jgi:hypothetical protein
MTQFPENPRSIQVTISHEIRTIKIPRIKSVPIPDKRETILVEAARNPQHPLHNEFIWDGAEAVRKLGLEKAAAIIQSVKAKLR